MGSDDDVQLPVPVDDLIDQGADGLGLLQIVATDSERHRREGLLTPGHLDVVSPAPGCVHDGAEVMETPRERGRDTCVAGHSGDQGHAT